VTKRRRSRPVPPAPRKVFDPAAPPSLYELDSFSLADIARWRKSSDRFDQLHRELYFGLEIQRVARRDELLAALRSKAALPLELAGWHRLVEYQYCLEPLSAHGSVTRYGGRFNLGIEVGSGAFGSFPALYLAEDLETAFREFHQVAAAAGTGGLTREDFALKRPGGFLSTEVHGHLELVFDLGDVAALRSFADLIATFKMPPRVSAIARELRLANTGLIRSSAQLQRAVLAKNWRAWPVQFDVPANSQVLGRMLCDAGFEAVLYPSVKNGQRCVAVFPTNLKRSSSFIGLSGRYPHSVAVHRLDAGSASECV
jgi:hypothetical protein